MTRPDSDRDVGRFSRWAESYERSPSQRFFFGPIHRRVIEAAGAIHGPPTILDVGCGTGRLLREAEKRWPEAQLIGLDPAAGMVEVARQLVPKAVFYLASADAIPLPDNSVDVALTTLSFHHWSGQFAGLKEVSRVLKPGGSFILADVNFPSWLRALVFALQAVAGTAGIMQELVRIASAKPATLEELLKGAGLTPTAQRLTVFGYVVILHAIKAIIRDSGMHFTPLGPTCSMECDRVAGDSVGV